MLRTRPCSFSIMNQLSAADGLVSALNTFIIPATVFIESALTMGYHSSPLLHPTLTTALRAIPDL